MTDEPHIHDLVQQIARLEGELKTSRAENEAMESRIDARLAGMQADMAKRDVEAAKRDVEAAKRDKDNQRWTITLVLGCTALVIGAVALFS